jgi:hypothetical protein
MISYEMSAATEVPLVRGHFCLVKDATKQDDITQ